MSSPNATASESYLQESRVPQALVVIVLCPTMAVGFVILRLYTRKFLLKRVFCDDYSIIAAAVLSVVLSVFMVIAFVNGSGRHIQALTQEQKILQSRISPSVHLNYLAAHMFLKLSIVLSYVRISVMAFERRLCYVLISLVGLSYLVLLSVSLARCIPFQAIWTPDIPGATCLNTTMLFFAGQGHCLAMDLIILVVPLFILRHLSAPWRQRVLLVIVVGFGGIACIAGALRLQVLRISTTSPDKTWDSFFSAIYGAIEVNSGIACACVVTFRPLFRRWWWFSGAEAEESHMSSGLPQPKRRRHVIDRNRIPTIDSAPVLTLSDDAELALDKNSVAASYPKREVNGVTSVTEDEDWRSADSTTVCGRSNEGPQHSGVNGPLPK
ncbi:hypothetical protein B0H63DRAFT_488550 [Podospora didyma]|uniref:Rhodopsin domain-containing protein n=1 Tax=Podospora didyma TaxID=330526 RepID=A0AAE0K1T5_9PEZI|nr:hypothetical protein B0H63DRAFT_488550 [Podospora didyma]